MNGRQIQSSYLVRVVRLLDVRRRGVKSFCDGHFSYVTIN